MHVLATSLAVLPLAWCGTTLSLTQSINNLGVPGIDCGYDYVVVGGGTSGLTIAARLAETAGVTVAVIEAGGFYEVDNGAGSVIPGMSAAQNTGTDVNDDNALIDWNFNTTPQAGAAGRTIRYARGKALGGSSGRNIMVYHRGTEGSYQKWADAVGNSSYSWDNLLPYFKKSVTVTAPSYGTGKRDRNGTVDYSASAFDNSLSGPLQVTWPNWASPLSSWLVNGFDDVGIHATQDVNSGSLNGSSWVSTTNNAADQTRDSSETSFLDYAVTKGSKVKVYQHTTAKKIIFNSANKATGVKVETSNNTYTITAKKEVIVSAGTFQSPQLLMVSGIGPKATLKSYGISVIKDLHGVGQNMWDHAMFGSTFPVNVITATRLVTDPTFQLEKLVEYQSQQGPLTAPGFGVLGFEKLPAASRANFTRATLTALAMFPADWPEVEYLGLDGILGYWRNANDQDVADGNNYGSVGAALIAPLSRGNVTIKRSDINDAPVINPNFLAHSADAEVAVAALKRARAVWAALPDLTTGAEYLPGPDVQTDAQLLTYIRSSMTQVWHAAGTCAMGKSTDRKAVVDKYAKVYGVAGLRVVDASVFPILPPGHPQSNCYMIAEKIAQDIKNGN